MVFCTTTHFWEATTAKRIKIDPRYQRKNVAQRLQFPVVGLQSVCGYQWGFPWAGASNDSGVVNDGKAIWVGGYFFGNVRDKTSNIIPTWHYAVFCC